MKNESMANFRGISIAFILIAIGSLLLSPVIIWLNIKNKLTRETMINILKSKVIRTWLLRRLASAVGAFLVAQGLLSDSQIADVTGAILVLASCAHSLWDKRDTIKQDIINLTNKPTV